MRKLILDFIQTTLQIFIAVCVILFLIGKTIHNPKPQRTVDVEKVQMLIDASSYRDKNGMVHLTETSETIAETIADNIEDAK